ncbi:MAG: N-acetylmuramoyl-L-alanine amidase [Clostridia bacterium]|nr:N-acetylmuramoyl-L-alanine amidase [Clostridia bacterium]MDD4145744.1 N-acetylmuramoyl-L-alanine amidase [Clostridia bacterium]
MQVIFLRKRFLAWLVLFSVVSLILIGFVSWRGKEDKLAIQAMSWVVAGRTLLLDPGHGGEDPGKVSPSGVLEKNINLAVAKKLYALLIQGGGTVYLTRTEDKALSNNEDTVRARKRADLQKRVEMIQKTEADLYIAIHCNAFPAGRWFGAQTFYAPDVPGSKELAACIQEELINFPGNTTRKPKSDNTSYLFKEANIPIVNVELGFLSNPQEEQLLQDSAYQDKLAWSIYAGIVRYLLEYGDQYCSTLKPFLSK